VFETFEKLLDPYPAEPPVTPPRGLWSFLWACTAGARGPIAAMAALTASIGVFEAYLFNLLGSVVDRLGRIEPSQLWEQEGRNLWLLVAIVAGAGAIYVARKKPNTAVQKSSSGSHKPTSHTGTKKS
jgi:ATP-binding cassette subfamily B multidrug efflux pump